MRSPHKAFSRKNTEGPIDGFNYVDEAMSKIKFRFNLKILYFVRTFIHLYCFINQFY